jgi:hypothetical protein
MSIQGTDIGEIGISITLAYGAAHYRQICHFPSGLNAGTKLLIVYILATLCPLLFAVGPQSVGDRVTESKR